MCQAKAEPAPILILSHRRVMHISTLKTEECSESEAGSARKPVQPEAQI